MAHMLKELIRGRKYPNRTYLLHAEDSYGSSIAFAESYCGSHGGISYQIAGFFIIKSFRK